MIKSKRLNPMVMPLLACTLLAASFTSQAASLQPEVKNTADTKEEVLSEEILSEEVSSEEVSSERVSSGRQENIYQAEPVNLSAAVTAAVCEEQRQLTEEARRNEAKAREEAEKAQEAAALKLSQQELLAAIIYCEAGNQPYVGQVAVGAVVMNRVKSGQYPDSIESVIYQSGQFGPVATGWLDKVRSTRGYTESAMQAAADALAGSNPVGSCLYFDQGGYGTKIGDHYFH